jgi:type III restriction enzyme
MKIKFDPNQKFQEDAINSIADLFEGQPADADNFLAHLSGEGVKSDQQMLAYEIGAIGNNLLLDEDAILENLKFIQNNNGLPVRDNLDGMNFSVEMETGTGKTYVYLRTIFELAKRYNFTKYIILVPSVAIKEGVKSSIEMMRDHFREIYARPFDAYVYDGKSPESVQSFATSTNIQIMVMTIDSVKGDKNTRIMHQERDKLNGIKPIDFLASTNPFIIMDEPQNMESELSKNAIIDLNAAATFRYSATHRNEYNLTYRLDPVDAHNEGLVKSIVVANARQEGSDAKPYLKLLEVNNSSGIYAKVEALIREKSGDVRRRPLKIYKGDNLAIKTNNDIYSNNWIVNTITTIPEEIEFANGQYLEKGKAIGDNNSQIQREMIRETIREHLRREYSLQSYGVKVISLFFVDKVSNYLEYDENGNEVEGLFARWFDELFIEERNSREYYKELLPQAPHELRKAYFAEMKKGGKTTVIDSSEGRGNANDSAAYDLIMRGKERLLDLNEPVRFIFSHSALKEGWDNPNVFQICMLRESSSGVDRRQTIGRGLRLPVNQQGERVRDRDVALLTVVANESYSEFATSLQKEYKDAGVSIGYVRKEEFAKLPSLADTNQVLGYNESNMIWESLRSRGMIDSDGKVLPSFQPTHIGFRLDLPEQYKLYESDVVAIVRDCRIEKYIKDASKRQTRTYNKAVIDSEEFRNLWDAISHKTTYRVEFDRGAIVQAAIAEIKKQPNIKPLRVEIKRSKVRLLRGGTNSSVIGERTQNLAGTYDLPNIVADLQEETSLTRSTIIDILSGSERLHEYLFNPNDFTQMAKRAITTVLAQIVIDGIQYEQIRGSIYELRELQEDGRQEKDKFIDRLYEVKNAQKTIVDYIAYDSDVEKDFAKILDDLEDVKLFMKLPDKFKIPTPVGSYNPDWAIVKEIDGKEHVYMIRETKGTQQTSLLRPTEEAKIECGKKHFEAIGIGDFAVSSPGDWNI